MDGSQNMKYNITGYIDEIIEQLGSEALTGNLVEKYT